MAGMAVRTIAMLLFLTVSQACPRDPPAGPDAGTEGPDARITPALAVDQLVFDSTRSTVNHEIFVMKTDGSSASRLTSDAAYENWWPRVSFSGNQARIAGGFPAGASPSLINVRMSEVLSR